MTEDQLRPFNSIKDLPVDVNVKIKKNRKYTFNSIKDLHKKLSNNPDDWSDDFQFYKRSSEKKQMKYL